MDFVGTLLNILRAINRCAMSCNRRNVENASLRFLKYVLTASYGASLQDNDSMDDIEYLETVPPTRREHHDDSDDSFNDEVNTVVLPYWFSNLSGHFLSTTTACHRSAEVFL